MPEAKKTVKVKVEYQRSEQYHEAHVTGASGGVSAVGEIWFQLYLDKISDPNSFEMEVSGDQVLEGVPNGGDPAHLMRVIHFGATMSREQAVILGNWLVTHGSIDIQSYAIQARKELEQK